MFRPLVDQQLVDVLVPDFLPDPDLAVSVGGVVVASNDNWGGNQQAAAQMTQVGAFDYLMPASLDAALAVADMAEPLDRAALLASRDALLRIAA